MFYVNCYRSLKVSNPILSLPFIQYIIYQVKSEAKFAFIFHMVYFLENFLLNPDQPLQLKTTKLIQKNLQEKI